MQKVVVKYLREAGVSTMMAQHHLKQGNVEKALVSMECAREHIKDARRAVEKDLANVCGCLEGAPETI